MSKKRICKIAIDLFMTVLLMVLMARQLTGASVHEWIGAVMFLVLIAHHILNRNWYANVFRGKYTTVRIIHTGINSLMTVAMLGMMISGIVLSREVFAFLQISGGIAWARSLHVLSAFWGFVLMALHLGLHWNMILGMVRKAVGTGDSKPKRMIQHSMTAGIVGYGFYAFLKNRFLSYLFLTSSFVFFDFEKPPVLFFAEYIGIMGLFIFLAHMIQKRVK